MSIESFILRFASTVTVRRPTFTQTSNGGLFRTFDDVAGLTEVSAWIQSRGLSETDAQGRISGRTATQIFFIGVVDIAVDDEILYPTSGDMGVYRVIEVFHPDSIYEDTYPNIHTTITATLVPPTEAGAA